MPKVQNKTKAKVSKLKFSKVLWLADLSYPQYNGGAERTDYVIKEAGKKLGLDIQDMHIADECDTNDYDLVVISNIHRWKDGVVSKMIEDTYTPIVFFSHDPLMHKWYPKAIKQAFCTVFMSPAHKKFYTRKLALGTHFIQPHGLTDMDSWYSSEDREDIYLYIGDLNGYKGVQNVYKWAMDNPDKEVRLWGRHMAKFPFLLDNFKYYGWLDQDKLAETLSKAKYFLHLPEFVDPCPRMVTFAMMSGCEIIGNENIGTFSYDWPWEDMDAVKKILKRAPRKFWKNINKHYEEY